MWNLPEEIERFVASKCPKGTSLTCLICSKWDEERSSKNYGTINCRPEHPFGYGPFNEHLKSTRHGNNVKKRDTFKSENERREKLGLPVKKKQRIQSLLAFATKKPTKEQVHNRVSKWRTSRNVDECKRMSDLLDMWTAVNSSSRFEWLSAKYYPGHNETWMGASNLRGDCRLTGCPHLVLMALVGCSWLTAKPYGGTGVLHINQKEFNSKIYMDPKQQVPSNFI